MKNKTIIVQGKGSIGIRHANNLIKLGYEPIFLRLKNKNYKIPHDRFNIKEIFNFNELVNRKPLGAIIATPTIYHPENALFFLNKEIPIYIEKPLGFNISSSNLNLLEANSKKILIHGGFNFLYSKEIQQLKKKIRLNREKIISAEIVCHTNAKKWHNWENPQESYTFNKELGGGVIHTCSHEINFLINFFPNAQLIKAKNIFENDVCVKSESNFKDIDVEIKLDLDFVNDKNKRYVSVLLKDKKVINFVFNQENEKKIKDESCFNSIKNFVDCIENNQNSLISTFEDAKKTYIMCEKILNA